MRSACRERKKQRTQWSDSERGRGEGMRRGRELGRLEDSEFFELVKTRPTLGRVFILSDPI